MKSDIVDQGDLEVLVQHFYEKLLEDQNMAPLFLDVAKIEIEEHFPRIVAYWNKMLFAQPGYKRHTMSIHRAVNAAHPFSDFHFEVWLHYFKLTVDELFEGEYADRAKYIATNVIFNMRKQFKVPMI